MTAPGEDTCSTVLEDGDGATTVVLDLVQPSVTGWRFGDHGRQSWGAKASWCETSFC
jgi:hypothetical protein